MIAHCTWQIELSCIIYLFPLSFFFSVSPSFQINKKVYLKSHVNTHFLLIMENYLWFEYSDLQFIEPSKENKIPCIDTSQISHLSVFSDVSASDWETERKKHHRTIVTWVEN